MTQAGWLSDPTGRFEYRYWDGSQWTANVSRGGQTASDPLSPPPPPGGAAPPPGGASASPSGATTALPSFTPPPFVPTPQAPAKPWTTPVQLFVLGGAVALAVGSFLPWVKASAGIFSVTTNGTDGDGVLTLILAVLVVALFLLVKPRRVAAIVTTVLAVVAAGIALYDTVNVSNKAHDLASSASGVSASIGVGLILAAIASVVLLAGGIMSIVETRS